jgi:hypothetical protein
VVRHKLSLVPLPASALDPVKQGWAQLGAEEQLMLKLGRGRDDAGHRGSGCTVAEGGDKERCVVM